MSSFFIVCALDHAVRPIMSSLKRPRQLPSNAPTPEVIVISDTEDEPVVKRVNRDASRPTTPGVRCAPPPGGCSADQQLQAAQGVSTLSLIWSFPLLDLR